MIIHLLQLEWKKYSQNSLFRLLFIFYIVALPLALYAWVYAYEAIFFNSIADQVNEAKFLARPDKIISFPKVWENLSYWGNWTVYIFIAFTSIFLITTEVQYKTLRQNIISGMTRNTYYLSKLILIIVISLACTAYFVVVGMSYGLIFSDNYAMIFDGLIAIPRFFLMVLNYLSFGLLLGFVFRNSGIAIFIYLAYTSFGELLLRLGMYKLWKSEWHIFAPMNVNEDLTPFPLYRFSEFLPEGTIPIRLLTYNEAFWITAIYTLIFMALGYWALVKRDL